MIKIETNFMVFRPRQRRQTINLTIKIDKNDIECVILDEISLGSLTFLRSQEKLQIKFLPSKILLTFFVL